MKPAFMQSRAVRFVLLVGTHLEGVDPHSQPKHKRGGMPTTFRPIGSLLCDPSLLYSSSRERKAEAEGGNPLCLIWPCTSLAHREENAG